ncbi:MAG: NusA-like transcription termination signal-binding factor [Candidatus Lokiarchaeota archaeon]|nr:NusA-like transcription termination signal-binding factor [Candidatus Lokiarchaeota archaeon]
MTRGIKFDKRTMELIQLFDTITGATTLDCVVFEEDDGSERICYMVNRKDLGKAIGKNGINVKKLREKLGKKIEVIAYSKELNKFIRYLLYPAKIERVEEQQRTDDKKVLIITVRPKDKGIAIGKNGRNIKKANVFIQRHTDVDSMVINMNE